MTSDEAFGRHGEFHVRADSPLKIAYMPFVSCVCFIEILFASMCFT